MTSGPTSPGRPPAPTTGSPSSAPGSPEPPHPLFRPTAEGGVPRVAPVELRTLLASPEPPLVLDVRPREQRTLAQLSGDRWIPLADLPESLTELPRHRSVVVYCHFGGVADRAVRYLLNVGFSHVAVLDGGIDEYARVVDPTIPRYHDPPSRGPLLQQFPNTRTGCLAYLLTDVSSGEAVIIDPGPDISPYLAALKSRVSHLKAIVETHTHADHLSGHAALHERTGAPIWLGQRSAARYPHQVLGEDQGLDFGRSELAVWETPGHTLDHLSLRADGAVFTGDTLLPGSCGRTDLGEGSADLLWESLTSKLLRLPDETEMFPAHYGPRHGLPPPERYSSTIGFERRTNEALTQPNREAFLAYMTEGWPAKPENFERIVQQNLER